MDLARIVETLNKRDDVAGLMVGNLHQAGLTEEEMAFLRTYQPEKVLIIYGTLAPGKPNHHVIEPIKGAWQKGIVRGKLVNMGWGAYLGYKGFVPTRREEQDEIPAVILSSDELVANWKMLDEFEGEGYRRILVPFEAENGEVGVGYIYAVNDNTI